jgi:hypothetical protein
MAEHLLKENCLKIVEIFLRLNINGNMIRTLYSRSGKRFSQIEAYRIGPIPFSCIETLFDLDSKTENPKSFKKIKDHQQSNNFNIFLLQEHSSIHNFPSTHLYSSVC